MIFKNTKNNYSSVTRFLHWIMALLIISLIVAGYCMTWLPRLENRWLIYSLHKATGFSVLILIIIRIIWRFINIWPALPKSLPIWQSLAAKINIFLLYCFILIMTLTGFIGSLISGHNVSFYGLFEIQSFAQNKQVGGLLFWVHEAASYIFTSLILLHISAAIFHHFIRKDNILMRMIKESDL